MGGHGTEFMKPHYAFAQKEIKRYGPSSGLRGRMEELEIGGGKIYCALPPGVLSNVLRYSDPEAFNGTLRFLGASDLEAKIGGSGELEFMRLLLDGPEQ